MFGTLTRDHKHLDNKCLGRLLGIINIWITNVWDSYQGSWTSGQQIFKTPTKGPNICMPKVWELLLRVPNIQTRNVPYPYQETIKIWMTKVLDPYKGSRTCGIQTLRTPTKCPEHLDKTHLGFLLRSTLLLGVHKNIDAKYFLRPLLENLDAQCSGPPLEVLSILATNCWNPYYGSKILDNKGLGPLLGDSNIWTTNVWNP